MFQPTTSPRTRAVFFTSCVRSSSHVKTPGRCGAWWCCVFAALEAFAAFEVSFFFAVLFFVMAFSVGLFGQRHCCVQTGDERPEPISTGLANPVDHQADPARSAARQ